MNERERERERARTSEPALGRGRSRDIGSFGEKLSLIEAPVGLGGRR